MSCALQPKRRTAGRSEPAGHTAPDQATKADTVGLRQNKAAKIGCAKMAGVVAVWARGGIRPASPKGHGAYTHPQAQATKGW